MSKPSKREHNLEKQLARAQATARVQCVLLTKTQFSKTFCADYQVLRRHYLLDKFWPSRGKNPTEQNSDSSDYVSHYDVLPNFDFSAIMDFFFDQAKALIAHLNWPKKGYVHRVFS